MVWVMFCLVLTVGHVLGDDRAFVIDDRTGQFKISTLGVKGTVSSIGQELADQVFSFTVDDYRPRDRTRKDFHSTGDITLRIRRANSSEDYATYSTTDVYQPPAREIEVQDALVAYDVTSLFNPGHGLQVERIYQQIRDENGGFSIRINLTNKQAFAQELGGLGMSMIFNNDWTNLDLNATAQHCSFTEPYIGQDASWVKVTRMSGTGRILFVSPHGQGGMNSWRPLLSDPTPRSGVAEGFYEYTFLADAYRSNEWQNVPDERLWTPTESIVLQPKASVSYALRFRLLSDVRDVEKGLVQMQELVVKIIPGYVIGMDMSDVQLFILPNRYTIDRISTSNETILQVNQTSTNSPWWTYRLLPLHYGRVRLTVHYRDATSKSYRQTISLFVLPAFRTHVETFGRFNAEKQWYANPSDPFGRDQSIMPYHWQLDQMILQDPRSFVVGLSDEAGAGPGLGFAIKNLYSPSSDQIHLIDLYINNTLFGSKGPTPQIPFETRLQWPDYSVVASLFWYPGMPGYNYTIRDGWDQNRSKTTWRSYNYVHPSAVYYSMYRLARDYPNLSTIHPWSWYLTQAYRTYLAMNQFGSYYAQFGLMVGSVFLRILEALRLENFQDEYHRMSDVQQSRAKVWQGLPFPFGSEFPWDSTGQEEIYLTARHFTLDELSNSTLAAILAYAHSMPNWGYHGSARRFWDFAFNGCFELNEGIERVLHHYGSGLNALPLIDGFEINPDDLYLLEVAIGSITGPLTNIQLNGASSMGLHGNPSKLIHDYYDADYGLAFYGLASVQSAFVVEHPALARPVCYLCDLRVSPDNSTWNITPRDAFHHRIYLEPLGTAFTLDTGTIDSMLIDWPSKRIELLLTAVPTPALFSVYRLHLSHRASCQARPGCDLRIISPPNPPLVREAFEIPVQPFPQLTTVELTW